MPVIFILFFSLLFSSQVVFAGEVSYNQFIVTKIKSDFIDIKRKSEVAFLYGNVVVERQDLSILADKMVVYYYEKNQEDSQSGIGSKIKKIEAKNNVRIFNDNFFATGEIGVYDPKENNFTLERNVVFNKGTSAAKGEKFVYNLTTKKAHLFGKDDEEQNQQNQNSPQDNRVTVIINDNDMKKDE